MTTIYKTKVGKISVQICEDQNIGLKKWIQGGMFGMLECGGSSNAKMIKEVIKYHASKMNLTISTVKHILYGTYSAEIFD